MACANSLFEMIIIFQLATAHSFWIMISKAFREIDTKRALMGCNNHRDISTTVNSDS